MRVFLVRLLLLLAVATLQANGVPINSRSTSLRHQQQHQLSANSGKVATVDRVNTAVALSDSSAAGTFSASKQSFRLMRKLCTLDDNDQQLQAKAPPEEINAVQGLKDASVTERDVTDDDFDDAKALKSNDGKLLTTTDRTKRSWLRSLLDRAFDSTQAVPAKLAIQSFRDQCTWAVAKALTTVTFTGYEDFVASLYKAEAAADYAKISAPQWKDVGNMLHDTKNGLGDTIKSGGWRSYNADDERYDRAFSKFFNSAAPKGVFFHNQEDAKAVYPRVESLEEEVAGATEIVKSLFQVQVQAGHAGFNGHSWDLIARALVGDLGVDRLNMPADDIFGIDGHSVYFVSATVDNGPMVQVLLALAKDGTAEATYADKFCHKLVGNSNVLRHHSGKWQRAERIAFQGVNGRQVDNTVAMQINVFFLKAPRSTVAHATITQQALKQTIIDALMGRAS